MYNIIHFDASHVTHILLQNRISSYWHMLSHYNYQNFQINTNFSTFARHLFICRMFIKRFLKWSVCSPFEDGHSSFSCLFLFSIWRWSQSSFISLLLFPISSFRHQHSNVFSQSRWVSFCFFQRKRTKKIMVVVNFPWDFVGHFDQCVYLWNIPYLFSSFPNLSDNQLLHPSLIFFYLFRLSN